MNNTQSFILLIVAVLLLSLSHQQEDIQTAVQLVEFIPGSCYNQSDCNNTRCPSSCIDCLNATFCNKCAYGYFLYQSQCIQCPDFSNFSTIVHCADCIEQGLKWQQGPEQFDQENRIKSLFKVQQCIGCSNVCSKVECTICDISNTCFSCGEGFFMNTTTAVCQKCFQGCISCIYSQTLQKEICKFCEYGLAQDSNFTCRNCSQLINYCISCYYGNQHVNLSDFNQLEKNQNLTNNQMNDIQARCLLCQDLYIQSLDYTHCIPCGSGCTHCDYQSIFSNGLHFYSGLISIITNPQLIQTYKFQCFRCQNNHYFHYNGQICLPCTIENCEKCYYGNETFNPSSIISFSFIQQSDSEAVQFNFTQRCHRCKEDYTISFDKTSCSHYEDPVLANCATWIEQQDGNKTCIKCRNGKSLQNNTCHQNCVNQNCESCYTYLDSIVSVSVEICIKCKQKGQYITMNGCQPCKQGCQSCGIHSFQQFVNLTEYIEFLYPQMQSSYLRVYEQENLINVNICLECQYSTQKILSDGSCKGCDVSCSHCYEDQMSSLQYQCEQCSPRIDVYNLIKNPMSTQVYYIMKPNEVEYKNSCGELFCPNFCNGCRPSLDSEKQRINPSFEPDSSLYNIFSQVCYSCATSEIDGTYVYYDQFLGRCLPCPLVLTKESCQRKLKAFTFYIDCEGLNDYMLEINGEEYITFSFVALLYQNNNVIYFTQIENDLYYNAYNILGITESEYNFYFLVNDTYNVQCQFPDSFFFTTKMRQNIYSMQRTKLLFGTYNKLTQEYNKDYANLYINNNILANYTHIKFQTCNIFSLNDLQQDGNNNKITLRFESNQLLVNEVHFQNVNFISSDSRIYNNLNFVISNPESIIFENVTFQNIANQVGFGLYTLKNKYSKQLSLTLINVTLVNCQITDQFLIDFTKHRDLQISIKNLLITSNSHIRGSEFFKLKNYQFNSFFLEMNNITIQNCSFTDSSLLQASYVTSGVVANNFNLLNNQFINTQDNEFYFLDINNISIFSGINITNNTFQSMQFLHFKELNQNQTFSIFENFSIIGNQFEGSLILGEATYLFTVSAYLRNIEIINNIASPDPQRQSILLQLINLDTITVTDLLEQDNFQMKTIDVKEVNKLMCGNIQFRSSSQAFQNKSCLEVEEFYSEVNLSNFSVQGKSMLDNSIVIINSNQDYSANSQEGTIKLSQMKFNNNIIYQRSQILSLSPVYISSFYGINIEILEASFINNTLDLLPKTSYFSSTSGFLINSIKSSLLIAHCFFINQTSHKQKNSLFINTESVIIRTSIFSGGNYKANVDYLGNQGGLATLQFQQLEVHESTFMNSLALQGGALHLIPRVQSIIFINSSQFSNTTTAFRKSILSEGGCIYLDSMEAEVNFTIFNSKFINITSYYKGGVMMIQSRLNISLTIIKCNFTNVYSMQGGMIYQKSSMNLHLESSLITHSQDFMEVYQKYFLANDINEIMNFQKQHALFILDQCNVQFVRNRFIMILIYHLIDLIGGTFIDEGSIYSTIFIFFGPLLNIQSASLVSMDGIIVFNLNQFSVTYRNSTTLYINKLIFINSVKFICKNSQFIGMSCSSCYEGSVHINDANAIDMQNTTFQNNIAENGGALYIVQPNFYFLQEDESIQIDESHNISLVRRNAQQLLNNSEITNIISNCSFIQNKATVNGGAIYLINPFLKFDNVLIRENNATSQGGGIYSKMKISQENFQFVNLVIANSTIENNKALIGGGISIQDKQPILLNNIVQNNKGTLYGNDMISQAKKLLILPNQNTFMYFYPGKVPSEPLIIQMLDYSNEVLMTEGSEVMVELKDQLQSIELYGQTYKQINQTAKGFVFDDIKFRGSIGSEFKVKFTSPTIQIPQFDANHSLIGYTNNYELVVTVKLLECLLGEVYMEATKECLFCKQNTYSISNKASQCLQCPQEMAICPGGAVMELFPGHWRTDNMTDKIVVCKNNKENCLGGTQNFTCKQGYIGAMCEACDIEKKVWEEHYANSQKYNCYSCAMVKNNSIKVFFLIMWTLVSVVISIRGTSRLIQTSIMLEYLYKMGFITGGKSSQAVDLTSVYIKIFTNYFQIIITISYFDLEMPSDIFTIPSLLGSPVEQMSYSLDCYLVTLQQSVPHLYFRMIYGLLLPFQYFLAIILFYIILIIISKNKAIPNIAYTIMIYLLIYLQPSMVYQLIELVSCRTIADVKYIKANVAFTCYSSEHLYYLVTIMLPFLLLWVVFQPGILFLQMKRSKHMLHQIRVLYKYGFMYQEYRQRAYLWEFVKIYEKIIIIIVLNLYDTEIKVKGILSFIVVFIYSYVAIKFQPYKQQMLNKVDLVSTIVCSVTIILGLFAYQNPYDYLIWLSFLIIIIINITFIIKMCRLIILGFTDKFEETIDQFLQFFIKKFPVLGQYIHYSIVSRKRVFHLWRVLRTHTKAKYVKNVIELKPKQIQIVVKALNNDMELVDLDPLQNEQAKLSSISQL